MEKFKPNYKKLIASLIIGFATAFLLFYFLLPAINPRSVGFWFYLTAVILAFGIPYLDLSVSKIRLSFVPNGNRRKSVRDIVRFKESKARRIWLIVIAAPLLFTLIMLLFSSTFFFARSYADVITVEDAVFEDDLPETKEITNIALMDTDSAIMLGNKTLGSLSNVVSQYDVGESYTQINYRGTPKKVANLEYDGFFKWIGNNDDGVPGMVMVDPVKNSAEYVELDTPMYYVESAFFGKDLSRKLRFSYPTKIFESVSFEIDEAGNPYYIVSCVTPTVSLFGAKDVSEVIIFDPCTGEGTLHSIDEIRDNDEFAWIDIVYTGDFACKKYNWHGTLAGGFFNSIIGNKGCKQTTDDFGYIAIEDDVWYFTGVTSVSSDKSNIGFTLSNARTGEYKFYPVIGAEEHSAMAAAEGEVQEKGYAASFPSLVNIAGQPTYIMVLKDDAGLVKLYALVNVENYGIVATGTTQAEAMTAYKKQLKQNDVSIGDADKEKLITVENIRLAMVADVSTVYITADSGEVYKGYLEADESLILIRQGDSISIKYSESDIEKIYIVSSWSFAE